MRTDVSLSCSGESDGAVRLELDTSQVTISTLLPHAAALKTAASILLCAGVTEATFKDGALYEGRS